jgi:hypothetical protein
MVDQTRTGFGVRGSGFAVLGSGENAGTYTKRAAKAAAHVVVEMGKLN